jgi:hypothetical protein
MMKNDQSDSTSTVGSNGGQDKRGRFVKGNKHGQGNPLAGRAAKLRAVLLQKVTDKDIAEITDRLIKMAKDGDLAAIKEILDRTVGKPGQVEMYERIEQLESKLAELTEDENEGETYCD